MAERTAEPTSTEIGNTECEAISVTQITPRIFSGQQKSMEEKALPGSHTYALAMVSTAAHTAWSMGGGTEERTSEVDD